MDSPFDVGVWPIQHRLFDSLQPSRIEALPSPRPGAPCGSTADAPRQQQIRLYYYPLPGNCMSLNDRMHRWFAGLTSAYPYAGNPYWRNLPSRRMIKPLVSVFLIISGFGFAVNLLLLERRPLMRGFFWPLLFGGTAAS